MSTTTSPPLLEALRVRWPGLDAIGGDPHEWVRVCDVTVDLGRQMLEHLNGQTRADGRCPRLADVMEAKRAEAATPNGPPVKPASQPSGPSTRGS